MTSTVLATFAVLKDHVKLKVSQDAVVIDSIVSRLHYRATFLILLGACLLVTSRQFIGEHIRCITDAGVPQNVINTFCFFTSTYTVVKHMNATAVESGELAHPGVGPAGKYDEVVHHAYYQWVPFVLFFQAISFYMPHYIWRSAEGGRLKYLVSGLHMASLALSEKPINAGKFTVMSKKDREQKIKDMRFAFLMRLHLNRPWAYYLGLCEVLNFVNVIVQIHLTNWFLGGAFLNLGHKVIEDDFEQAVDTLDVVFPKVTKCLFHKYGPSGSIQKHDALCVMALNIVNEKIYTFLWFWFVILAVVTGLGLVWRVLTMFLHARSKPFNRFVFSMACPGRFDPWEMLTMTKEYHFGDWLFLYYIAKNVDNYVFKDLLVGLAEDLKMRQMGFVAPVLTFEDEEELLKSGGEQGTVPATSQTESKKTH